MEIFDLKDAEDRVVAFEVYSFSRRAARRLVRATPGATLLAFHGLREIFCEFEVDGVQFEMREPYNDNSRYWIGPSAPGRFSQIEAVRKTFARARDFWLFVWIPGRDQR